MADQLKAIDLAVVRDRYPALAESDDGVLLGQVHAYFRILLYEIVKERAEQ